MSVITPVLNSVSTLELTLSSVAAQTYPNLEHIVIDGGSTDGTIDLLRSFQSSVPLRWLSEPDTGMYAAINKGIKLAQGEVLAYLNGDDIYFPWSVDSAVSALMSSRSDLAFGDLVVLAKQGRRNRTVRIQFYPRFRARIYAYELNLGQPSVFWKRGVSDEVGGFDERMRYCGDFEYWLRTATAGFRYTHVREVLAIAVEHEEALSIIHADELQREIERTRERYADRLKARNFARLHALAHLAQWRLQVLMLRLNLRRDRPSSWPKLIRFLKEMDADLTGSSILRLILPLPLSRSWIMWRLDPAAFERKLIDELRSRRRIA